MHTKGENGNNMAESRGSGGDLGKEAVPYVWGKRTLSTYY
jgi:hypothetical protein